jgi:glutaconate CoA-transferase subunit A
MSADLETTIGELVSDGATVAIAGVGLNRKPMSLVRALVATGARDLVIVSVLGSVDVEFLLSAGVVGELHTAGTSLDGLGLAPRYRKARQDASPCVVEWSEGSLVTALEAAARGLDSMPCSTSPASEIVELNPNLRVEPDPFTGAPTTVVRALRPDLALLQGSCVDEAGNVHIDGDPSIENLMARASRVVMATVLSQEPRRERAASISRVWLDHVRVDRASAWPTMCAPDVDLDRDAIMAWLVSKGQDLTGLEPGAPP